MVGEETRCQTAVRHSEAALTLGANHNLSDSWSACHERRLPASTHFVDSLNVGVAFQQRRFILPFALHKCAVEQYRLLRGLDFSIFYTRRIFAQGQ